MKDKQAREELAYSQSSIKSIRDTQWKLEHRFAALLEALCLKKKPLHEPYRLVKTNENKPTTL